MTSTMKTVFLIIGIAFFSVMLLQLSFGSGSRQLIWKGLEPAFQENWKQSTFDDGRLLDAHFQDVFEHVVELR
jgi:hypothetical protein